MKEDYGYWLTENLQDYSLMNYKGEDILNTVTLISPNFLKISLKMKIC